MTSLLFVQRGPYCSMSTFSDEFGWRRLCFVSELNHIRKSECAVLPLRFSNESDYSASLAHWHARPRLSHRSVLMYPPSCAHCSLSFFFLACCQSPRHPFRGQQVSRTAKWRAVLTISVTVAPLLPSPPYLLLSLSLLSLLFPPLFPSPPSHPVTYFFLSSHAAKRILTTPRNGRWFLFSLLRLHHLIN